MDERPHISASQLRTLLTCGKQWEYRYVEGLVVPPRGAALRGRVVHQMREGNLTRLLKEGQLPEVDEVRDLTSDAVDAEFAGDVLLDEGERLEDVRGEVKDHSVRLSVEDRTAIQPLIRPLATEHAFRFSLPDPIGWDVIGFMDVLADETDYAAIGPGATPADVPDAKKRVGIREVKTKTKTPPEKDAHTSTQLTLYDIAVQVERGRPADRITYDGLIALKKDTKSVIYETRRDDADRQVALNRIVQGVKAIEAGVMVPAPEDSWVCSEKWCGYWSRCPFGGRGRRRPGS